MEFLNETDALKCIQDIVSKSDEIKFAVAFWGQGAIENLGLKDRSKRPQILCNLDSGACNPDVIKKLLETCDVKRHEKLHAKVYWTKVGMVMGSSNASTNGLAVEGDAGKGWREANIFSDDPAMLNSAKAWFDRLFNEGIPVQKDDIDKYRALWNTRKRHAATGQTLTTDLREAFEGSPDHPAWHNVKVGFWCEDATPEAEEEFNDRTAGKKTSADFFEDWNQYLIGVGVLISINSKSTKLEIWNVENPVDIKFRTVLVSPTKSINSGVMRNITISKTDSEDLKYLAKHSVEKGERVLPLDEVAKELGWRSKSSSHPA